MRVLNSKLTFSPSDLTCFHESPYASWMERLYFSHRELAPQPDPDDSFNSLLQTLGDRHERAQLRRFIDDGLTVSDILSICDKTDFALAHQTTLEQMRLGVDVIFQAALQSGSFAGFADFLIKVPGKSLLGDYHYEVWDTKLASEVKVKFVLQLCCYAEMLQQLQGRLPEEIAVVPSRGALQRLRLADYFAYYQHVKSEFLAYQAAFSCDAPWPDPFESKEYGRWSKTAEKWLEDNDHLSLTANITRRQIKKLNQAGIYSRKQLVDYTEAVPKGLNPEIFERLQQQARLQLQSIGQPTPCYELLPPTESGFHPLSTLPAPHPADLYFDLEGFPLLAGGLEYLWGVGYLENDNFSFRGWWAHDETEEKLAMQGFVEWAYQRWLDNPDMHIYHYGHYEITALRRLMGRYGLCELEVDNLLRNQVFVDLYQITRNSLRIGEPKYSIKNVEHLYRPKRDTDVASGGDSLVEYQQWRDLYTAGEESKDPTQSSILQKIWLYNRDDCESTWQLAKFLAKEAQQHQIYPATAPVDGEVKKSKDLSNLIDYRQRLLAKAGQANGNDKLAYETMAWLVEFYQREKKPVFWRLFDLAAKPESELLDEADVMAGCRIIRQQDNKFLVQFEAEQEIQRPKADKFIVIAPEVTGLLTVTLENLDLRNNQVTLISGKPLPTRFQLLPYEYVNATVLENALTQQAYNFVSDNHRSSLSWKLLTRAKPELVEGQTLEQLMVSNGSHHLPQIIKSVSALNNSFLTIQGPPGTGKTYTGARIIADLVKSGKRVAISANSHKALQHLLLAAKQVLNAENINAEAACVLNGNHDLLEHGITGLTSNAKLLGHLHADIVGATAFVLAKSECVGQFDYLFVDEAGQVSLANLIAMSGCARNLVLLGDQMQLGQPIQACHPGASGQSALDYLMEDFAVVPKDRGILLNCSYRMHSAITERISQCIYQGQLVSDPQNDNQHLPNFQLTDGRNTPFGIFPIAIEHDGNTTSSLEEVSEIKQLCARLAGQAYVDKNGQTTEITFTDIMVITPYNRQVFLLQSELPEGVRVGTVDKFQGQEAPVVLVSMCCSDVDEAPRGIEFLFDTRRLNVAISRAKALCLVVHSNKLISFVNDVCKVQQLNIFLNMLN